MKMKKNCLSLIALLMVIFSCTVLTGCFEKSAEEKEADAQQSQIDKATGGTNNDLPDITNLQERKLMKQIMELCDKSDLVCYIYNYSEYYGKYNYVGKCVGFGLPYGTEYTNPEKMVYRNSGGGMVTLPQADPNGLYKASNVDATWVCMIDDETGEKYVTFNEPKITIWARPMAKRMLIEVPDGYDAVLKSVKK